MTSQEFRTLDSYYILIKLSEAIKETGKKLSISKCLLLKVARGNDAIVYYTKKKKITVSLYSNDITIEVKHVGQTLVEHFGLIRSAI